MSKKKQCCFCDMPFNGGVVNSDGRGVCYGCITSCVGLLDREVVVPIPDLSWDDVEPDIKDVVIGTLLGANEALAEHVDRAVSHRLIALEQRMVIARYVIDAAIGELRGMPPQDSWSSFSPDRREFVITNLTRGFARLGRDEAVAIHYGLQHHAARCRKISRAHLAAARRLGWAGMPMPS